MKRRDFISASAAATIGSSLLGCGQENTRESSPADLGERQLKTVLDVMRVRAEGDPLEAILTVNHSAPGTGESCDILVVGGGMGGVAAAWAAARRGHNVCLLEETDWLGGQMTSQGVAALDEHEHIEAFGGTRSYYKLCETIRTYYRNFTDRPAGNEVLNPGRCWVSRLAFEPKVALNAIDELLSPERDSGRLQVFLRTKVTAAQTDGDRVVRITATNLDNGDNAQFTFQYVLDATELGDLLPLTGTEYVVGAESMSQTSEPHAQPDEAKPHVVQSCTYTFALERRPEDENHRMSAPERYEHYSDHQPYGLRIHVHGGEIYGETTGWLDYQVFEPTPGTKGPLWEYRRLVEAAQFPNHYEHDVTMFNWPGSDYRDEPLVDQSAETLATILQDAKRVGLGFAYWLQTDAPNPAGEEGFSNLLLQPNIMGSDDGLGKHPYIRECRRIQALKTVIEQEVAVAYQTGPRAAHFKDSVGIGWYPIDIHQVSQDEVGTSTRTKPFQIPLGALIPTRMENLIAANKNIGTTHITNGCYRLHPVEWNVGEAAGLVAAFAIEQRETPKTIREDATLLGSFQKEVVAEGVPLCWLIDVPVWSPDFEATQRLVMAGGYGSKADRLEFEPTLLATAEDQAAWFSNTGKQNDTRLPRNQPLSRAAFARAMMELGHI
jgi:hypothetical protein